MAKEFWTSDLHLNHRGILEYTDRGRYLTMGRNPNPEDTGPAVTIEEHNKWVVDVINSYVGERDRLYFLGDMMIGANKWVAAYWISQINCMHKELVYGNHDDDHREFYATSGLFESVQDRITMKLNKKLIIMDHFPIVEWNAGHHSSWMLHGHSHGNFDYLKANLHDKRILDVGFDNSVKVLGHYAPFEFADIEKYMEGRISIDHHGKAD
jgi:calcineurin-like phosphoesterase family protein